MAAAAPELLQELGQQLVDLLKFDDASVRETGAALFADLFAQEPAYYQKFPQLFDPFAAVFRDVSPAVRAKMVEHGVRLAHPPKELPRPPANLAEQLVEELKGKVCDPDDKVRTTAVKAVCAACWESIGPFAPLVAAARERMRDKKSQVAGVAMEQMVTLYRHHAAVAAAGGGSVPEPLAEVPSTLLAAYLSNTCDRNQIENLLYQKLLPTDGAQRLRAITDVHAVLKGKERDVLKSMLRNKRKAQIQLSRWLELQQKLKESKGDGQAKKEQAALVKQMIDESSDPPRAKEVWESLATSKDGNLRRALAVVASPTSEYDELTTALKDARARIAQRLNHQAALPAVSNILARSAMVVLWKGGAHTLVEDVAAELDAMPGDGADAELPKLKLLLDAVNIFPQLMEGAGDAIAKCVKAAQEAGAPRRGVLCQLLKLVEAASPALATAGKETRKAIVAALCGQCCAKDAGVGKLAAQCLSTSVLADATRARTFATLVSKLRPALDMKAGAQQHAALAVLAALAKRAPEALGEKAERSALLAHLRDEVTRKPAAADADAAKGGGKKKAAAAAAGGDALSPRSSAALGARCESQRLTLLLLANEALGAAGKAASDLKVAAAAGADLLSGGDDDDGDEGESRSACGRSCSSPSCTGSSKRRARSARRRRAATTSRRSCGWRRRRRCSSRRGSATSRSSRRPPRRGARSR